MYLCISSQALSRVHYFCLLPMLSRMPAPSHARCPHAMCHTVAPRPLARASPKAKLKTQKHNQNQPKKHFLGTAVSSPPPAWWGVTDGCHYLPAQGSSQGLAFKGDYILRRKQKMFNTKSPFI